MFLLKLAALNVLRSPGRSLATILSTAIGITVLIFLYSFNYGGIEGAYDRMISTTAGHVQVHAHDFQNSLEAKMVVPEASIVIEKLEIDPMVKAISARVKNEALLTADDQSALITLYGIDPKAESKITCLQDKLISGDYLSSSDDRGILIGDTLANKLKLNVDSDRLVIMSQAIDGTASGSAYHVCGIFHVGGQPLDEHAAYVTLDSAQKLLGIGTSVHEIVILLKDRRLISKFCDQLKQQLKELGNYDVQPWDEIMSTEVAGPRWYLSIQSIVFLVITTLIAVGIMNTMLMAVLERTKELGVMLALGTSPSQLMALIVTESVVLQLIGLLVGLISGLALVTYFGYVGIVQHGLEKGLEMTFVPSTFYPRLQLVDLWKTVFSLTIISFIANLYPAWKAAHISPVEAIHN